MTRRRRMGTASLIGVAFLLSSSAALSQAGSPPPRALLDVGAEFQGLSGGFGGWRTTSAHLVMPKGARDVWYAELAWSERFFQRATFASVANAHTLSARMYVFTAIAASGGDGWFYPRFRADAVLARKWGASGALVTGVGAGYYAYKDVHRDRSATASVAYHFGDGVVLEGGARGTWSEPGAVFAPGWFIAATAGRDGLRTVSMRVGAGREAYALLDPATEIVNFESGSVRATGREWVGAAWGISAAVEGYQNPLYRRMGGRLGVFRAF